MDRLQRIFIGVSIIIFLICIDVALLIRFSGDLFLQRAFFHLFARYDLTGAVLSMLIMFAVTILIKINPELSIGQILDKMGNNPVRVAIASFGCLLLGAFFVYHKHPLSMDEYMP